MSATRTLLCELDDIVDGGAKGFNADTLFAIRRGQRVYLYKNHCPHAGTPLNWMPDRFLTADASTIICTTHGALFEIESGICVSGPCPGQKLTTVPCDVREGQIWIAE